MRASSVRRPRSSGGPQLLPPCWPLTAAQAQASTGSASAPTLNKKNFSGQDPPSPPAQAAIFQPPRHHHRLEQPPPRHRNCCINNTTGASSSRHASSTGSFVSASTSAHPAVLPPPSLPFSAIAAVSAADRRTIARCRRAASRTARISHLAPRDLAPPASIDPRAPRRYCPFDISVLAAPCRLPHIHLRRIWASSSINRPITSILTAPAAMDRRRPGRLLA